MQKLTRLTLLPFVAVTFVLIAITTQAYSQNQDVEQSYKLGPGDMIMIDVFGEDDLTMEVMLADTGIINYPFLGELDIEGMTIFEFEQLLISGLKGPYLVDPDITVTVMQYRNVYVTGEVQRPGGYPYQPGLTVEKAIAMAGGFTERASRSKIDIKRQDDPAAEFVRTRLSSPVRPGEIISVNQSFF